MENYFKELQLKYPKVYPSFPYSGFELAIGWKDLINRLSKEINDYLISNPNVEFTIEQVKSKSGCLRFYCITPDSNIWKIVERYEMESGNICEECGKPGKLLKTNSWIYTVCNECGQKHITISKNLRNF